MDPAWLSHPAAAEESAHLQETLVLVQSETVLVTDEEKRLSVEATNAAHHMDTDYAEYMVRTMLHHHAAQALTHLHLASKKPYFTRIDFRELPTPATPQPEPSTYYIGKYGVLRSDSLEPAIIDWRSPVANLYYSGQVGPMHYVAPDGEIHGDLTLKRQFTIEDGEMRALFDADVVSQEAYLQDVLGSVTTDNLKDIVTTIQVEQNNIIRHSWLTSLFVQGVAGSGKTTIALHRIAWLLYTLKDTVLPEQMMILAPNPLFLDYISAVLPELGVDTVQQTTYIGLAQRILGEYMPKLERHDVLGLLVEAQSQGEALAIECRVKGSTAFLAHIERYIEKLERDVIPARGVRFGPVDVFTRDELQRLFLVDLKPHPLRTRQEQIEKILKRRVKLALEKVLETIEAGCVQRVEMLRLKPLDDEDRRARMRRVYESRDQRVEEAKAAAKTFAKTAITGWKPLNLLDLYREAWEMPPADDLFGDATARDAFEAARDATLHRLSRKRASQEDLAPLMRICQAAFGFQQRTPVSHLVLDEAQDFSAYEYAMLRRIAPYSGITAVGDLTQGVHAYRGISAWSQAMDAVGGGDLLHLRTSYRTTVEIMDLANRVAASHPYPDQQLATPVLRHGPAPAIERFDGAKARDARIVEQVRAWLAEGFHSIAIIERSETEAKRLYKALSPHLPGLRFLDPEQKTYMGGMLVVPAVAVKGLEFDCVIVADASEAAFEDTTQNARLLYVCVTRPLHRLLVACVGTPSGMLTREYEGE